MVLFRVEVGVRLLAVAEGEKEGRGKSAGGTGGRKKSEILTAKRNGPVTKGKGEQMGKHLEGKKRKKTIVEM